MANLSEAALAAAKTYIAASENYCLFFIDWWPLCMTKSEWSGWMQAVGSVMAILAGFFVAERTLKIQSKLQLQREMEAKRIKDRMQFYIIADLLQAAESWGEHILGVAEKKETISLESAIYIGQSVVDSLRSITLDHIPAVEAIRRVHMVILGAESVLAAIKVAHAAGDSKVAGLYETITLRAKRLKKFALVDKDYCTSEAQRISTPEEIKRRVEIIAARYRALDEIQEE